MEIERRFLEDRFKLQTGLAPPCDDLYRFIIDSVSCDYTSRNTVSSTHLVLASSAFSSSCVLIELNKENSRTP
jgi:hypothetical protein